MSEVVRLVSARIYEVAGGLEGQRRIEELLEAR